MSSAPKKPKLIPIRHNTTLPPVAQTANLVLIILAKAGKNSWSTLITDPEKFANILLTEEQKQLIRDHQYLLSYLATAPVRTVFACPICERFAFIDKAPPPSRCTLTLGCPGKPVKATTTAPRLTATKPVEPRT